MSDLSKTLIAYNRVSAPAIAAIVGIVIVYMSIYIPDLIFAVPVETFFVFYWLKIFGIKKRVLASLIVFLAVAIAASAMFADLVYTADGVAPPVDVQNGAVVNTSISPYLGQSSNYNVSFYISGNTTMGKYWMNVNSSTNAKFGIHVPSTEFNSVDYSNGTILIYTHITNITAPGFYYYTLFLDNGTYYVNNIGPVIASYTSLFALELLSYVPGYLIIFELIFIVGIFLARSISHSAQFSRSRTPPSQ